MPVLLLARHGRTWANVNGVLAGRTPGVGLDDEGETQAKALAARVAPVPLAALVTSPLERCQLTADRVRAERSGPDPAADDRLLEVGYGSWQGHELKTLAKDPLWKVVQATPSAVRFPGGEALRDVSARAIEAVRAWDAQVEEEQGPDAAWMAITHGDVIKAILADALGLHLDQFQRIVVDPCSVSAIRYEPGRPFVIRVNDVGGDLASLVPRRKRRRRSRRSRGSSDAAVGGGLGGESGGALSDGRADGSSANSVVGSSGGPG